MQASIVERQTWKRCRRRWLLTADTQQNLEPNTMQPALKLGGMVQVALSEWTEHPEIDPVKYFAHISSEELKVAKRLYEERVGAVISDVELDPLYEVIDLGLAMVTNYRDYYKQPLPDGFRQIQTEQRAIVEIPGTLHWECEAKHEFDPPPGATLRKGDVLPFHQHGECPHPLIATPHYVRGTIDTLVQDKKGRILPLERKTYGQRPEKRRLQHDDQMLGYNWIVEQLFPGQVGGILYDGLWKRKAPPTTSRSKITGGKNTIDDLFYRDIIIRPPEEVEEFGKLLRVEVLDMAHAIATNAIYINRTWQGCWDCGVERICAAMSRGEDVQYVIDTFYRQRVSEYTEEDDD